MKIKIELELPIEVVGSDVIIKSHEALNKLFGSSATASSLHIFGIEKLPHNTWKVPLSKLKERYKDMVQKIDDMQQKTIIVRQILDSIDGEKEEDVFSSKKNGVKKGTVRGPYKKHPKKWTQEEWNIIKNNMDKSPKKLMKFFPGRTIRAIITARSKMRNNSSLKTTKQFNGWTEADDKIILKNMKESFSKKKIREIQKLLSMKRSENSINMRKHYLAHKKQSKTPVRKMINVEIPIEPPKAQQEIGFPKFSMIHNTKFILETIKHNLIGKGKLEYRDVSWIPSDTEWSEDLWNIFIAEFMNNSINISKFLGVEHRFAIDNDGTMKKIIYRIKEE